MLKVELQRKLHQSRIADMQHLAEGGAYIGDVAIDGVELRVVPEVENVATKFHLESFAQLGPLREAHIPVVDSGATANRARRIADGTQRNGRVRKDVGIKGKTGNGLASPGGWVEGLRQGTRAGGTNGVARIDRLELRPGTEVRLTRLLEVKGGIQQFNVILRGYADGEAALERQDSRNLPAVEQLPFEPIHLRHWEIPNIVKDQAVPRVVV